MRFLLQSRCLPRISVFVLKLPPDILRERSCKQSHFFSRFAKMSTLTDHHLSDDRQFSEIVIDYQNQVANIITWLYNREEELKKRPHESDLEDAPFSELLEEYSMHEKFISELCEYCQTIMKGKEDGQEMRENISSLSEEDLDEIGIQMDSMLVCYEKLKILATDRLKNLQRIIEVRQQAKIEKFENWLTDFSVRKSNLNSIGPNYDMILRQIKEMQGLQAEVQKQQNFLNSLLSSVIIFDEVDSGSLEIRSSSSEILDKRIQRIDRQWTEICQFVESRNQKLQKAESIWKILSIEGPQLFAWLDRIKRSLNELADAVRNLPDLKTDPKFAAKLLGRSNKIDLDIKHKQSFYTNLENRVRAEIETFDDPCSMFVIELEKKLEEMQEDWNMIMNQKRTLDFSLQALSDPLYVEKSRCNNASDTIDLDPDRRMVNSLSDPKGFENSLSSESRSLLNCNNNESTTYSNELDSHDDISSTSMTASYSMNMASFVADEDPSRLVPPSQHNIVNHHRNDAHLASQHFLEPNTAIYPNDADHRSHSHNCRVEEWKHSLESFSTWLKRAETSLGIGDGSLDTMSSDNQAKSSWDRLDFQNQLNILNEIEQQIFTSCQDEFDCLILQGQQIIEDLIPEIGENKYEANMKDILADIEIRYSSVRRSISDRRCKLADKSVWLELLTTLRTSCDVIVDKMGLIMPETTIGVDLITLAQQQDQLMRLRADLKEDEQIQGSIRDARYFLKLCDSLRTQQCRSRSSLMVENVQQPHDRNGNPITSPSDEEIWLSFRDLKEDIEVQLDRLTLHYSELSQLIEDRLERLDEVHKEMHALQHKMQELASELQVAEIMKSNWPKLSELSIEQLSEQLEDLKLFRERFSEIQTAHKTMNSIFEWMTQTDVPLSQSNLKRISELNTIYSLIEVSIDERQKLIEQAFDNQSSSEQRFLNQTLADLPRWERRVATSKVPYFIDHSTNKTGWDHPKFTELLQSISAIDQYLFSAYRAALKLRAVQNKLGINLLMLERLKEIFTYVPGPDINQHAQNSPKTWNSITDNNDTLVGVEQIIFYLKAIYETIKNDENSSLDIPLSIDLTLNWLLNLYDSTRTGYINSLSLKVGLSIICCATREEKYIYMYDLVADQRSRTVDSKKLGTLFESCIRVPIYLGEGESFGGAEIIEASTRDCFERSKYNPQHPSSIDLVDYLNWLKSEPRFIIWLPLLHRLLISENTRHPYKCKLCGAKPIIGLRYRCLKCIKFNVCQECFLTGRHVFEHHDPNKHPMQEYCCATSSGENVRDLTRILRNKMRSKFTTSSVDRANVECQ